MRRLVGRRKLLLRLFDLNIAAAGTDADGGTAAVDDSTYMVFVEAALHSDGLRDVDAAGTSIRVEVEMGVSYGETDGAASGAELPVCGGLASDFDIAAACAGLEGSGETVEVNGAAAGFGFDIAGPGLLEFNIAGAGA